MVKGRRMFYNDVVNCVREHLDKWYATSNHHETAIQLVNEYEERIRECERKRCANILVEKLYPESYYKESFRDDFLKMFSEDKEEK